VFGLEKAEIYLASCVLEGGCAASLADFDEVEWQGDTHALWKQIQPYRDWLMAQIAISKLRELPEATVPIMAASVGTHLPLIREFLCRNGYNTATLTPEHSFSVDASTGLPTDEDPFDWFLTTLIMQFLNDIRFDTGSIPQPSQSIGDNAVRLQKMLGGFKSIQ
jgi:hypothetical protein